MNKHFLYREFLSATPSGGMYFGCGDLKEFHLLHFLFTAKVINRESYLAKLQQVKHGKFNRMAKNYVFEGKWYNLETVYDVHLEHLPVAGDVKETFGTILPYFQILTGGSLGSVRREYLDFMTKWNVAYDWSWGYRLTLLGIQFESMYEFDLNWDRWSGEPSEYDRELAYPTYLERSGVVEKFGALLG